MLDRMPAVFGSVLSMMQPDDSKVKDDSRNVLETYTYGAGRSKLMVEISSERRYFAWGGQSVVAEFVEAGSSTIPAYDRAYIYAGSRLLMTYTSAGEARENKQYHHPDRLGTQLVTTGASSSFRQTTFPFGTTISAETTGNSNQVFTSYDRSSTTGLDHAVNRTYSKGQGRFTQVDPIAMASASIGNPQSNNLYAYTQNMPTDFVDPSGLQRRLIAYACFCVNTSVPGWTDPNPECQTCYMWIEDGTGYSGRGNPIDHGWGGGTSSGGGSTLKTIGFVNNFCGTAQGPPPGPHARWRGSDGRYYKGPFSLQKVAKIGSRATFGIGTAISVTQMANGDVSPAQGTLDIVMGGVGAFGGPKGWIVAGTYFLYQSVPPPAYPQGNVRAVSTNTCHGR